MKIQCHQCNQRIEADDQWAGQLASCPTCHAEITIPNCAVPPLISARAATSKSSAALKWVAVASGRVLKWVAVASGGVICILIFVIGLMSGGGSAGTAPSGATEITSRQQAKMRAAIERVLEQDKGTSAGSTTVAQIVARIRAIDTSECPNDFRAAYLAHIHAWESMGEVEGRARAFKADREGAGDLVEGFIRGFLGDPWGKANEIQNVQSQLQIDYQSARQQVKQTFNRVEEMAVAYGASLPKK